MVYNRIIWLTWLRSGTLALLKDRKIHDRYEAYLQRVSGHEQVSHWSDEEIQAHIHYLQSEGYLTHAPRRLALSIKNHSALRCCNGAYSINLRNDMVGFALSNKRARCITVLQAQYLAPP